jgi:shikimate kinase
VKSGSSNIRRKVDRVVLTGFMGAGKTTVGRLLAPLLDWPFLDIDVLLQATTSLSISQIFALHQEEGFRTLEAAEVSRALLLHHVVIALGGGALEAEQTRSRIANDPATLLVYLEAPLPLSLARCAGELDPAVRPLLQDRRSLEQRFLTRLPAYQAAQRIIPTDRYSAQEIAELLKTEVVPFLDL